MNLAKLLVFLVLFVTLIFPEEAEAKKSHSKNSIRKRQQRLRKMKRKNKNNDNRTKAERKHSKNAFMNSFLTKALELMEDYDEEYYDDAPIINIRFKRESTRYQESVILNKLRTENL